MRLSFEHRLHGEHERFAPGAFDASIGKPIRLSMQGQPSGTCTLVAAEVAADRRSVTLTVEVLDHYGDFIIGLPNEREVSALPPMSIGFTFPPAERRA